MADIKQLKLKIGSTKNIKKITSAMEVISTIKLQKVKKSAEHLREYINTFLWMLTTISHYVDLFPRPSEKATRQLAILVSSEKWLCGSLNSLLFKYFDEQYHAQKDLLDVYVIGKKWKEFCARRWYSVIHTLHLADTFTQSDIQSLFDFLSEQQAKGGYKSITVWYNFFKNTMKQIPAGFQLFPLSIEKFEEFMNVLEISLHRPTIIRNTHHMNLEPNKKTIVAKAYDIMMNVIVYGALLHNKTGEFAARMLAMKGAKDNASSIIGDLTLAYNKARQDAITKEVLEIVSAKAVLDD